MKLSLYSLLISWLTKSLMKQSLQIVLAGFAVTVVATLGLFATPTFADTLSKLTSGTLISNGTSDNALSIIQATDVGKSRSRSGALHLDNTGNRNTGLTLYSNLDDRVAQPLMRMEIDNELWDEEVLYIHSDSPTSRGLIRLDSPAPEIEFVETDQKGAAGKFELRVQHDVFQINSRLPDDSSFIKRVGMTHEGDLELYSGGIKVENGEVSEFAGGINITGGCLAVDGKCVDLDGLASGKTPEREETSAPAPKPAPAPAATVPYSSIDITAGEPPAIDCNSYTERGRMYLDYEQNRLYVCNGPDRGWDYSDLSN